jgi:predicted Zn-dependent protease with MMP-like domain
MTGRTLHKKSTQTMPDLDLDSDAFEKLVVDELDLLPDDMIDGLDNVVFVVEDRPEDGSLDTLGLYDGVNLTERGQYGFGELPDRIILYREPLLDVSADLEELKDQVHVTLVHEIAHFYGIDDEELHKLGWG